jgi:hypothetical protein
MKANGWMGGKYLCVVGREKIIFTRGYWFLDKTGFWTNIKTSATLGTFSTGLSH